MHFLGEDSFHTAIITAFQDMGAVHGDLPTIFGTEEAECQVGALDHRLYQDIPWGVVRKFQIGFGDVDRGIHADRFVVGYGIGVVAALSDFEPAVDGGAKDST